MDGRSPETVLETWPEDGPKVLWRQAAGEGYAAVAVVGERVFFFDRHGNRARLVALNSSSGAEHWRSEYPTAYVDSFDFSNGPRTSPVVDGEGDDQRVYTFGVEGRLRCHRADDGKILWDLDTAERYGVVQNFFGVGSSPFVEGDALLVMIGGSPADSPGIQSGKVTTSGSAIVAFDKRTGRELYRVGDELASYASLLVTSWKDRRLGLAFARGGLLGFDPARGSVDFHFPWRAKKLYSVNAATPVVVGDTVFLTESYRLGGVLLRIAADSEGRLEHQVVWQDPPRRGQSLASHWASPVYRDGFLYGCHGENSGSAELRCVEHGSGKVRWSERGLGRSTITATKRNLLVLGESGELVLVSSNPDRFEALARTQLPLTRPAWQAPVLAHGRLYVRGKEELLCLDLRPRPASTGSEAT